MNMPLAYNPRILLTDDNAVNLKLLRAHLGQQYHLLLEAASGDECLATLNRQNVDLLLLDMNMPGVSGFDVLQSIPKLAKAARPRVMIVSADHSPETVAKAFKAGADDYLATPYSQEELLARVQTQLALKRRSQYLEDLVAVRTRELSDTNQRLQQTLHQLLQAEKMASLGQLSAGIAHEINNPIAYINSNLQMLANYCGDFEQLAQAYMGIPENFSDDPRWLQAKELENKNNFRFLFGDAKQLLQESLTGVTRVTQIVHDLRVFSHPEQQSWQTVGINACIESALNIANNEIKYKANVIKNYGEIPAIQCVVPQINQVLVNLLVNAAQAIDDFGEIKITTSHTVNNQAIIEIEDNGQGIANLNLDKIYDPFFTTKPVGEGTGLGLSVSYGIIQSHNGSIAVETDEGKGSKFIITLPIKQKEKSPSPAQSAH
ncbi:hybrid sensor histidine kinase/response regulator [Halioxenophilus aromaticivorans]|uniref:histidine kinase n=1 Tax=Halioxenophilus aromaticivorans TaxID=1306992 RepID=A0AAV3U948_9ALTE